MIVDDRHLDFEAHLEWFNSLGYEPDHARTEAQVRHAVFMSSALADLLLEMVALADKLKSHDGIYFMRHGVGRRLQMILWSYQAITSIVAPDRVAPISADERPSLTRDINVIYMHLSGVLDNFAWCFLYEKDPSLIEELSFSKISLFSKEIRKKTRFPDFWEETRQHQNWAKELKERRDPVAHRIPLYIPPSTLTPDEEAHSNQLMERHAKLTAEGDFEEADDVFRQLDGIGRFLPCFVHHPDSEFVPIYPTIPTDMAHLVRLGRAARDHIP